MKVLGMPTGPQVSQVGVPAFCDFHEKQGTLWQDQRGQDAHGVYSEPPMQLRKGSDILEDDQKDLWGFL
jgi:hypothetical protein